eukprot:scaffold42954_cov74-Phaeocystis_antarctica.AAC.9
MHTALAVALNVERSGGCVLVVRGARGGSSATPRELRWRRGAKDKRWAALARIVRIREQGADARRECVVMQESDPLAVRRLRLWKSQLQIGW